MDEEIVAALEQFGEPDDEVRINQLTPPPFTMMQNLPVTAVDQTRDLRVTVQKTARAAGFGEEQIDDVVHATAEALQNVFKHGHHTAVLSIIRLVDWVIVLVTQPGRWPTMPTLDGDPEQALDLDHAERGGVGLEMAAHRSDALELLADGQIVVLQFRLRPARR
jgi:anti-sigma regulatory factor (Ser/Thr protein kinase)